MVFTVEQMKESLGALAIALGLSLIASEAPAQSAPDWGKAEYESNCASCHGLGGKGDGPLSESFRTKAADLTTLAKRNDGVFPAQRVYEIIDGRQEVAAHGPRAMPVWGRDYRSQVPDVTLGDTQIYGLKDAVTHNKLIALVDYLHRLQVK
jgi:mono/diheme cytochrome c family protein